MVSTDFLLPPLRESDIDRLYALWEYFHLNYWMWTSEYVNDKGKGVQFSKCTISSDTTFPEYTVQRIPERQNSDVNAKTGLAPYSELLEGEYCISEGLVRGL